MADKGINTEKRELRRRRRVRNQVIAYVSIALFLVAVIGGSVFGIAKLTGFMSEKKQAKELAAQLEEMTNQEEAVIEPPAVIEEPAAAPVEEVDWLDEMVDTMIANMPLEDKVAGLFMITPEALTDVDVVTKAGDGTSEALNNYAVGGLIYFKENIKDKEQLTELLANTSGMTKYPLFLAVDEEGGDVSRVANSSIEVEKTAPMSEIGASGDINQAYLAGTTIGTYLFELGFNLDFAPVADVVADAKASPLGTRSFGADPTAVGDMVSSAVMGLQETKVSACMKHFPGIGKSSEDTHEGMAVLERTLDELRAEEFIPFQAGINAGADMIMVSHASLPSILTDNTPCSLSEQMITDVLRTELGYDGIVITDAMNMKAITEYYTSEESAIMALKAGADMILMPDDFKAAYEGVLAAVKDGTIAEERVNESLKRILRVKCRDDVPAVSETENLPEDTADGAAAAQPGTEDATAEDAAAADGSAEPEKEAKTDQAE